MFKINSEKLTICINFFFSQSVNRLASETVTLKGVTIPKGVGVLIPIYDVMRDPEYFSDPEVFRPER